MSAVVLYFSGNYPAGKVVSLRGFAIQCPVEIVLPHHSLGSEFVKASPL